MTITNDSISVSTTAVQIVPSNTSRKKLAIKNTGQYTVYIGSDTSVTSSNGYPIDPSEEFLSNDYTGVYYGICATGESTTIKYIDMAK